MAKYMINGEALTRTTLRKARGLVEDKIGLYGSNMFGGTYPDDIHKGIPWPRYVVYSYGIHFPMLVCEIADHGDIWYVNGDKYSKSTSRQMAAVVPHNVDTTFMTTMRLKEIIAVGYGRAQIEAPFTGRAIGFALRQPLNEAIENAFGMRPDYDTADNGII